MWHRGQKLTWGCEYCDGEGEIDAFVAFNDWPVGDTWIQHYLCPRCGERARRIEEKKDNKVIAVWLRCKSCKHREKL